MKHALGTTASISQRSQRTTTYRQLTTASTQALSTLSMVDFRESTSRPSTYFRRNWAALTGQKSKDPTLATRSLITFPTRVANMFSRWAGKSTTTASAAELTAAHVAGSNLDLESTMFSLAQRR